MPSTAQNVRFSAGFTHNLTLNSQLSIIDQLPRVRIEVLPFLRDESGHEHDEGRLAEDARWLAGAGGGGGGLCGGGGAQPRGDVAPVGTQQGGVGAGIAIKQLRTRWLAAED